ncbi:uncharacterized protein LOC143347193 [Colletes latitarsis]|uniref:uncharacterized protein LOC143347193 n=1 Tax=Colletes latitarsis TaxID=2605962 RepID=UPI00403713D0
MGNAKSKSKRGSRAKVYGKIGHDGQYKTPSLSNDEEYEDMEMLLLKRAIERNPEIFVLNNLMMCVPFFRNYEKEIMHVKQSLVSAREAQLNKHLPPQKHVLLPDVLQEHVAQTVGFTSSRQTFRTTIEPLQPVRIYTVHDNIEITEQQSLYYSILNDSTSYNILLKPTKHQGYVQLQLQETPNDACKDDGMDLSSIAENDDEINSDEESVYGPKVRLNMLPFRGYKYGEIRGRMQAHSRSLPNLHDEIEAISNRKALSRSTRNVHTDVDSENAMSIVNQKHRIKRARFKIEPPKGEREKQRVEKQTPRTKAQGSASQSLTSSISSGYRSDNYTMDSDSSCNRSQSVRAEKVSNDEESYENYIMTAQLPRHCFKRVTYTADGRVYDPREDKRQLLNSKQRRIKLAMRRHNYDLFYVSSTVFMQHFINVFVARLAKCFGFDKECLEDARREGCIIYCDRVMISNAFKHSRIEQYEIIPSVWLQWPNCAQEWLDRPRSTWPEYYDVEKIKKYGCYAVPEGFVPKRGSSNLIEDLEWQLTFPTGERYLETCMTQSQVQVYFIALMLHKSFLRPIFDTMFGLTTAHIRHKLFWMIEENDRPSKWPDNRTGECLLTLLDSLYHGISQNDPILRDYFIRDRNLFQRVPSEHLLHTQKQLKRILENPVMYVFHAMENIRYSDNFFPRLDYEGLLRILTTDSLSLINPALSQYVSKPMPQPSKERPPEENKYDNRGFWDHLKNQRQTHPVRTVTNKTLINTRKATDSIIEISTRCAELEGPRLYILLDFFIRHFIKIAERCNQYGDVRLKDVYLHQAERLSTLLFEIKRYKSDARAYFDKIKVIRKKSTTMSNDPPETPKRNQEMAIFVSPLRNRFMQEIAEKTSDSPNTETEQSQVAEATVHETPQETGKQEIPQASKTKKRPNLKSKTANPPKVVLFETIPEKLSDNSTYI